MDFVIIQINVRKIRMSINVNFRDESSDESKIPRATEYNRITRI